MRLSYFSPAGSCPRPDVPLSYQCGGGQASQSHRPRAGPLLRHRGAQQPPARGAARPRAWPRARTPRCHTRAHAGGVSWPLIGPPVLNTDLMVQEETYEALLLVRQQDRDVTMVRKSGNSNIG